jgi:hypothetical protein
MRGSFKGLTYEYTFQIEQYWMILQMVWRFAHPQTALKLMGDDVYSFDPNGDYSYAPVTSAIETEYNKFRKLQMYQQMIATVAQIPNPKTPQIINFLLEKVYDILGPDYLEIKKSLLDTGKQSQLAAMNGGMPQGQGGENMQGSMPSTEQPMSNQSGNPQSMGEMDSRSQMDGVM